MIKVIDSMCGSGKSTKMFNIMNRMFSDDMTRKFLYVTPFLSEIEVRVPNEMPALQFKTPTNNGQGKIAGLTNLVENGHNIATTHVLFSMLTPEIVDSLIEQDYVLVIDEALDCVRQESNLNTKDVEALLISHMVTVNYKERGRLYWNEQVYPEHDGKYSEVRNMCELGVAYAYKDQFLMFEYPPKLLSGLSEVYILTYLFNGSDMRCWIDINEIPYEIMDNNELGLLSEQDIKQRVRENLNILKPRSLLATKQRNGTLSKSWFDNSSKVMTDKYKKIMRSVVSHSKVRAGEVFWTTFKSEQSKLQGAGYTRGISEDMPAFLPLNIRATNDYRDYRLCMYGCNLFKNPVQVNYIEAQGVDVDEDTYALSEMIQFIWRGRIRQYEPMDVLILSNRMRKLLEDWLDK